MSSNNKIYIMVNQYKVQESIKNLEMGFNTAGSSCMEYLISLYNIIFSYQCFIFIFIICTMIILVERSNEFIYELQYEHTFCDVNKVVVKVDKDLTLFRPLDKEKKVVQNEILEFIWTVVPAFILISIMLPSFSLLYALEENYLGGNKEFNVNIKASGYQWFWHYEYPEIKIIGVDIVNYDCNEFDSYLLQHMDVVPQRDRMLLSVDSVLLSPQQIDMQIYVSAGDVIHSWAIPSLGIKIDACPGRINHITVCIWKEGIYYGQCSEICGIYHGFMPIVIEVTTPLNFFKYLRNISDILDIEDPTFENLEQKIKLKKSGIFRKKINWDDPESLKYRGYA